MNNLSHGCTSCHYPNCQRHTCPICHPEEHRHYNHEEKRNTSPDCSLYSLGLNVSHDWQEIGDLFICRRCGKQIKRIK